MSIAYLLLLAFPAAMILAALSDLFTMTIPNHISLVLFALFLVIAPIAGLSLEETLMHLAAGFAVLVLGIILFATGTFGGGDAKLMAAGALWLGIGQIVPYFAYITILGGVLAVAILLYRRIPEMLFPPLVPVWATRLRQRDCGIPYGIAISAATLIAFPATKLYALILA
ncbi:prepilin peptidase [Filomicrobium sp.]|uniref:A24 family peptidase n=1 Tax=Filomicrobium sp. TaxID=2024831 RepID=UPI0025910387|nr:prepilin peptidase [Filomicrobium sp.]MCV0370305.1 prepilin peptidase [Filomicrobium sp.]